MSDEDFSKSLGLQDDLNCRICILVRKVSAKWFHLKQEQLLPDSPTVLLFNRAWTPFVNSDIVFDLEYEFSKSLGIQISIKTAELRKLTPFVSQRFFCFYKREGAESFGQWALELTEYLANKVYEMKQSKNWEQ